MNRLPALVGIALLGIALPAWAGAQLEPIVLNGGGFAFDPANQILDDRYAGAELFVHPTGCPVGWPESGEPDVPCDPVSHTSRPTNILIGEGGVVGAVTLFPGALLELQGGLIEGTLHVESGVLLRGGLVRGSLETSGSGGFTAYGGRVDGDLWLEHRDEVLLGQASDLGGGEIGGAIFVVDAQARLAIFGSDFAVDGQPVPYGELAATSGVLTGSLWLGGALDNAFRHGGASCGESLPTCEGTILLEPSPDPAWIVIANGLAPPEPSNVVDTELGDLGVQVRDVGCASIPAAWPLTCLEPGAPTSAELAAGSSTPFAIVTDASSLVASGGTHDTVFALAQGHLEWKGGQAGGIGARERADLEITGGDVERASIVDQSTGWLVGGRVGVVQVGDDASFEVEGGVIDLALITESTVPLRIRAGSIAMVGSLGPVEMDGGEVAVFEVLGGSLTIRDGFVEQLRLDLEPEPAFASAPPARTRIQGGTVRTLEASGDGSFEISGGELGRVRVEGFDEEVTELELSGGRIHAGVAGSDEGYEGLQELGDLWLAPGAVGTWRGGTIEGELRVGSESSLTIVGSGFRDGLERPVEGPIRCVSIFGAPDPSFLTVCRGTLSGTLVSGETFTNRYAVTEGGEIRLVPEPDPVALALAAGLVLAARARRRP